MPAISPLVAGGDALSVLETAGFRPSVLAALKKGAASGGVGNWPASLPSLLSLVSIRPSSSAVLLGGGVASSTLGRSEAGGVVPTLWIFEFGFWILDFSAALLRGP